jgi:hypothetical protein
VVVSKSAGSMSPKDVEKYVHAAGAGWVLKGLGSLDSIQAGKGGVASVQWSAGPAAPLGAPAISTSISVFPGPSGGAYIPFPWPSWLSRVPRCPPHLSRSFGEHPGFRLARWDPPLNPFALMGPPPLTHRGQRCCRALQRRVRGWHAATACCRADCRAHQRDPHDHPGLGGPGQRRSAIGGRLLRGRHGREIYLAGADQMADRAAEQDGASENAGGRAESGRLKRRFSSLHWRGERDRRPIARAI